MNLFANSAVRSSVISEIPAFARQRPFVISLARRASRSIKAARTASQQPFRETVNCTKSALRLAQRLDCRISNPLSTVRSTFRTNWSRESISGVRTHPAWRQKPGALSCHGRSSQLSRQTTNHILYRRGFANICPTVNGLGRSQSNAGRLANPRPVPTVLQFERMAQTTNTVDNAQSSNPPKRSVSPGPVLEQDFVRQQVQKQQKNNFHSTALKQLNMVSQTVNKTALHPGGIEYVVVDPLAMKTKH